MWSDPIGNSWRVHTQSTQTQVQLYALPFTCPALHPNTSDIVWNWDHTSFVAHQSIRHHDKCINSHIIDGESLEILAAWNWKEQCNYGLDALARLESFGHCNCITGWQGQCHYNLPEDFSYPNRVQEYYLSIESILFSWGARLNEDMSFFCGDNKPLHNTVSLTLQPRNRTSAAEGVYR